MWKFLRTEMLVILALTEDANRTDSEIADTFGMKKGTVSAVRRRLLDAGALRYAYVPAFNRLGCEMLGFHYGTTDPAVRSDTKSNHYLDFCGKAPQIFHALIGGSSVIFYTALRNATEFETFVQNHNSFFAGSKRASKAKLSHVMFPYSLSRITPVPQFAPLVHDFFELDVPPPKTVPVITVKHDQVDLGPSEKKVLSTVVASPLATDREIAHQVKLSRQAVTRTRNNLIEDGLITRTCIPSLYRWGFEICAVAHPRFTVDMGWERRLKSEPKEVVERSYYTLSKADESVATYMVSKFTDYSEELENMLSWYHRAGALEEPPEMILFSLDRSTELRTFDFAPAVKELLRSETR